MTDKVGQYLDSYFNILIRFGYEFLIVLIYLKTSG